MMERSSMKDLIASFQKIPIVKSGDYNYFVHPLSDGIPAISPSLLAGASECMMELFPDRDEFDLMVTAEAMGIPLAAALSTLISKPFSIARKRSYCLPGEITVGQETGYSSSKLHLNLPGSGGRSVIVDDVLSTGGTLRALVKGIRRSGWCVDRAFFLFNKMEKVPKNELEEEVELRITSLLDIEFVGDVFIARRSGNDLRIGP
ncbi:MAG: adenine phosphoribosyltransferase [Candidatus Thermoplasmatota archaeon]|nr:adenine phosphoribosyltransferase [Candidatus Thermoplasmatota archaeon]